MLDGLSSAILNQKETKTKQIWCSILCKYVDVPDIEVQKGIHVNSQSVIDKLATTGIYQSQTRGITVVGSSAVPG